MHSFTMTFKVNAPDDWKEWSHECVCVSYCKKCKFDMFCNHYLFIENLPTCMEPEELIKLLTNFKQGDLF